MTTSERLAEEYKVGAATIRRDSAFAEAVEALAENVGAQLKQQVLAPGRRTLEV